MTRPVPRNTLVPILVALLIPGATVPGVTAGTLMGRVNMSGAGTRDVQESSLSPYPAQLGSLGRAHANPRTVTTPMDVVIYIEGPATWVTERKIRERPKLQQIRQSFQPRVLGIPVGSAVDFPNADMIFHNVFSYSKAKRFDLGYYGRGKSRSVNFDRPGLVKVFCDIHSNMAAYIYVVETPFVTQPDESGEYEISDIPDGQYVLKTWHPTRGSQTHRVLITGEVTRLDLDL